jgi:hypothetical protein
MKIKRGGVLHVAETADGHLITPFHPKIAAQVEKVANS